MTEMTSAKMSPEEYMLRPVSEEEYARQKAEIAEAREAKELAKAERVERFRSIALGLLAARQQEEELSKALGEAILQEESLNSGVIPMLEELGLNHLDRQDAVNVAKGVVTVPEVKAREKRKRAKKALPGTLTKRGVTRKRGLPEGVKVARQGMRPADRAKREGQQQRLRVLMSRLDNREMVELVEMALERFGHVLRR